MGVPFLEEDNPQSPVPASPDMGGWSPVVPNAPQSTPPPPGRFKRMLMGGLSAAAEAGLNYAGVMTDEQKDALRAQTRQRLADAAESQARTNVMNSGMEMEDTPLGPMPRSTWSKLGPAYVTGQARISAADKTAQAKEWAQKLNTTMQGLKLGYQVDVDDDGNLKFGAIPKESLSVPAQAAGKGNSGAGRIDPIILSQLGPMPDPTTNPAAAKLWGIEAEKLKTRMAVAPRVAGYEALNAGRYADFYDPNTDTYQRLPNAVGSGAGMLPANLAFKNMPKVAQFNEMQTAAKSLRSAINGLDRDFTAEQRAKLQMAMNAPSESILSNEIQAILGTEQLTDKQQDYVIWLKQMNERLLSLRNVAGMGQGAEDMRKAIQATLPNVTSKDKNYALKQMNAVDQQISSLYTGVGGKKQIPSGESSSGPKVGEIQDGYRYRGGNPSDPNSWIKVK